MEKWQITLTEKKHSSNQLFSNFYRKNVTFTKFLSKKSESKFPQFLHCLNWTWGKRLVVNKTLIGRFSHKYNFDGILAFFARFHVIFVFVFCNYFDSLTSPLGNHPTLPQNCNLFSIKKGLFSYVVKPRCGKAQLTK